ncbi:hypothetical protein Aperf_G00000035719 [Anoplocephala perfoliata]
MKFPQKNQTATMLNHNYSEMGATAAADGLIYQNTEVITEVLCMLNGLCSQVASPSPSISHLGDKKSTISYAEAKPINLTRQQASNYDSELIFPLFTTKGQFVCPNCSQDFLNRDVLAMHMMESVHSEACSNTNNNTNSSNEDRNTRSNNCHYIKLTPIFHQANLAYRCVRFPVPSSCSSAQSDQLLQPSMKKILPLLDAGIPRPGEKLRRLISVFAEEDGSEQVEDACITASSLLLKRLRSCELKVKNQAREQPNRASSKPGGVPIANHNSFAEVSNNFGKIRLVNKTKHSDLGPNGLFKVGLNL